MANLSANTQAILLLTAPLLNGKRGGDGPKLLSAGAYRKLAHWLHGRSFSPADLLGRDADALSQECEPTLDIPPLKPLLSRGFQLSQAIERWNQRSIWVASRADADYPRRFKERLGEAAPPVVYGCGHPNLFGKGGLAIVGSRNAPDELLRHTADVARLCAEAGHPVVSGGARGVDQAAMRGAGEAEGQVIGVLADSLERAAIRREHREPLMSGNMILCSPYDPQAGFNTGHAMQRNKLIYALADAALIVNADFEKGGTWNGAVEQLGTHRHIVVFVRSDGGKSKALSALMRKGAHPWPNPASSSAFSDILTRKPSSEADVAPMGLFETRDDSAANGHQLHTPEESDAAAELQQYIRHLVLSSKMPLTVDGLAKRLDVTKPQARNWLQQLCEKGVLVRRTKPVRYESAGNE